MGKRSNFERVGHDFYPTPYEAFAPLLPHIVKGAFVEPCAGNGSLIRHLEKHLYECVYASDIFPQAEGIETADVLMFDHTLPPCQYIITNPPWDRALLHPMIEKFRNHADTWLLFDAGWMHTSQASEHLKYCRKIVSVGRVKWFGDSKMSGMDDACWYNFGLLPERTTFINQK